VWSGFRPDGVSGLAPDDVFRLQKELRQHMLSLGGDLESVRAEVARLRGRIRAALAMARAEAEHNAYDVAAMVAGPRSASQIVGELLRATAEAEAAKPADLSDTHAYVCGTMPPRRFLAWLLDACRRRELQRSADARWRAHERAMRAKAARALRQRRSAAGRANDGGEAADAEGRARRAEQVERAAARAERLREQAALLALEDGVEVRAEWGEEYREWLRAAAARRRAAPPPVGEGGSDASRRLKTHDGSMLGRVKRFGFAKRLRVDFGPRVGPLWLTPTARGGWADADGFSVEVFDVAARARAALEASRARRERSLAERPLLEGGDTTRLTGIAKNHDLVSVVAEPGPMGLKLRAGDGGLGVSVTGFQLSIANAKRFARAGVRPGMTLAAIDGRPLASEPFASVLMSLKTLSAERKRLTFARADDGHVLELAAKFAVARDASAAKRIQRGFRRSMGPRLRRERAEEEAFWTRAGEISAGAEAVIVRVPAGAPLGVTLKPGRGDVGAVVRGFSRAAGEGEGAGAVEAHGGVQVGMRLSSVDGADTRTMPTPALFALLRAAVAGSRSRRAESEGAGIDGARPLRLIFGTKGAEALRERALQEGKADLESLAKKRARSSHAVQKFKALIGRKKRPASAPKSPTAKRP
jgi:hypothetical protein